MDSQNRQWKGKTGGGSFGQWFLFTVLGKIKVSALYPVLYLVIPFYLLFGRKGYTYAMTYFRKHLGMTWFQAFKATYKNHITFGKVVLDKFALLAGNAKQFNIEVENIEIFNEATCKPEGAFVMSAHIGNFELAAHCLHQDKKQFYSLVYGGESQAIVERREQTLSKFNMNLISVTNDMAHLFAIKDAIETGNMVIIHGDRLFGSPKSFSADFLGKPAKFPIGAFRIATQLEAPIYVVYIMKGKGLSYQGYVRKLEYPADERSSVKKAECLGKQFVATLEEILKKYPEQWFNYYDFWEELA